MSENSGYRMHSRGYKTKGYEYKDRYVDDKICPECDGISVYRDEWSTIVSYKCLRRSCRHQWFENVNEPQEDPKDMVSKYEQIKIDEELKENQVIIFTCSNREKEILEKNNIKFNYINI